MNLQKLIERSIASEQTLCIIFCWRHTNENIGLIVPKRGGYPEDVAKAVSSLALVNFPYSTGQVIMIDEGITLSRF